MEGVTDFLESSTIHGLSYIATTKKCARLFWILAVLGGFSTATFLIHQSFQNWQDSPVTTSIETLSISEIKLPKVTVCPPKDTYTDLNYDLTMAENVVLTDKMRDDLFSYALDVIWDQNDYFGKLKEDNMYYNWYNGFTEVKSPKLDSYFGLNYFIDTSALSGVVTTQYYGQKFQPDLVEKGINYKVFVHPTRIDKNKNVTLHFKLEKVSITELSNGRFDRYMGTGKGNLEKDEKTILLDYKNPQKQKEIRLWRYVGTKDLESMSMETMPGFKFSWWYSGDKITIEPIFSNFRMNKIFVK